MKTIRKWKYFLLYDACEMPEIAAYLMKAKGAYSVPITERSLYTFMIDKKYVWQTLQKQMTILYSSQCNTKLKNPFSAALTLLNSEFVLRRMVE